MFTSSHLLTTHSLASLPTLKVISADGETRTEATLTCFDFPTGHHNRKDIPLPEGAGTHHPLPTRQTDVSLIFTTEKPNFNGLGEKIPSPPFFCKS